MSARNFSIPIIIILSVFIAFGTLRVFPLGVDLAFPAMSHQIDNAKLMFLIHITAAPIALMLGSFQLMPKFRNKHRKIHRWVGRTYAVSVLIGGISAIFIAFQIDGIGSTIGFALLAIAWLITTARAVQMARAKNIAAHRRWMIQSFALSFAAVTLRLQLLVFGAGFDMPYEQVYPIVAWSCWVPNLIFAAWYVRRNPRLQKSMV